MTDRNLSRSTENVVTLLAEFSMESLNSVGNVTQVAINLFDEEHNYDDEEVR